MNNNSSRYYCKICNKKYASSSSLWNHNTRYHYGINTNIIETSESDLKTSENILQNSESEIKPTEKKKYNCRKCNKIFNNIKTRWSHEKICKNKIILEDNKSTESKEKIVNNIITNNTNNTTNNNTTNNGTINNITINNFGNESVNNLTTKEIKKLANMNLNAYSYIIELLNFNKNSPENHNFCTTSLEGDYINYYNKKNNKIEKMNKKTFLDKVLNVAITKLEDIIFRLEFNMNDDIIDEQYFTKLQETAAKSNNLITKHRKSYHTNINEISYNNKEIVLDTWKNIQQSNDKHDTDDSSMSDVSNYKYSLDLDASDYDD
jgi:hypothetical protein